MNRVSSTFLRGLVSSVAMLASLSYMSTSLGITCPKTEDIKEVAARYSVERLSGKLVYMGWRFRTYSGASNQVVSFKFAMADSEEGGTWCYYSTKPMGQGIALIGVGVDSSPIQQTPFWRPCPSSAPIHPPPNTLCCGPGFSRAEDPIQCIFP